jgi:hypothetical protein
MMRRPFLALAGSLLLSGALVEAHHSIASVYDGSKSVKLEGTISKFEFVNPHPVLTIDVVSAEGTAEPWRLEMDNRSELAGIGVTTQTFKPGDRVVVAGSPARSMVRSIYLLKLERPADGFGYEQVGGSPRIRSRSR